jgi:hypothetical protein
MHLDGEPVSVRLASASGDEDSVAVGCARVALWISVRGGVRPSDLGSGACGKSSSAVANTRRRPSLFFPARRLVNHLVRVKRAEVGRRQA